MCLANLYTVVIGISVFVGRHIDYVTPKINDFFQSKLIFV